MCTACYKLKTWVYMSALNFTRQLEFTRQHVSTLYPLIKQLLEFGLNITWKKAFPPHADLIITATITGGGGNIFEVGESTYLNCDTSHHLENHTLTYMWLRCNMTILEAVEDTLMLGPLRTSDSGMYSCRVMANNTFLSAPVTHTSEGVSISVQGT